jgi:hypothetical protein
MAKTSLDQAAVTEIAGALSRISELSSKKIMESSDATERRALETFVQTTVTAHAEELLGCWFTVNTQYRPLVQGVAALLRNAQGAIAAANAAVERQGK